jgi:6-phosphogluconolactonase
MKSILLLFLICLTNLASAQKYYLFAGTYTGTGSKGIYVYQFDAATGSFKNLSNTDSSTNPSYLVISNSGKYIYSVNETKGENPGSVSSYKFDKAEGKLHLLNNQLTGGDDPCYITLTRNDKWLVVANYSGGSITLLPIDKNGSVGTYRQLLHDTGSSIDKSRQEKAHVHSTVFSPDENYLFTPDLGIDKVMVYRFNPQSPEPLKLSSPSSVKVKPGSGPRHFTFHPNKKFAYLVNELSGSVCAYSYSAGKLSKLQESSTHPREYKGAIGSADIHVSPDGKFLYVSNRGEENTLTIFSINKSGRLTLVDYQSTLGKTPRNFIIDPSGNYLLVANQESGNVVIFKRNKRSGLLSATGKEILIPKPVCLQMIPQ